MIVVPAAVNAEKAASFEDVGLREGAQDQGIKKGAKERPVDGYSEISRKERSRGDHDTRTLSNIDIRNQEMYFEN